RQAGEGPGLRVPWMLRLEGTISIQQCQDGASSKARKPQAPALGRGHDSVDTWRALVPLA
ncbi:MAG: hypothetical protein QF535_18175, partial [Anaerolineales bacterium]|nr:hypothetical protein [Anaerolineales bacterium]